MARVEKEDAVMGILQDLHRTKDKGLKDLFCTLINGLSTGIPVFEGSGGPDAHDKADLI